MASKTMGSNLCLGLAQKLQAAVQFAGTHSIYRHCLNSLELTTPQTLVLSLFYGLLRADTATVLNLLSIAPYLPQLRSSFIGIWLRDDYRFRQEDVAKVLSTLARLVSEGVVAVPLPIIIALCGLEEKYDVFSFFYEAGDTTAQEMLASLNPLVTRATQAGPQGVKDQASEARPVVESAFTQTDIEIQQMGRKETYTDSFPSTSKVQHQRTKRQPLPRLLYSTLKINQVLRRHRKPVRSTQLSMGIHSATNFAANRTSASVIKDYLDEDRIEELINVPDIQGNLPIHRAALEGRTDVVDALLQHGAGPNDVNLLQMTPLQMAISSNQTETIIFLLSHGASLMNKDYMGMTALHHAAHHGMPEVMRLLLCYRIRKETKDSFGNTALLIASQLGHTEIVGLLLAAGANRKVKDSEGFQPLDWALQHGDVEMVNLLKGHAHRYT